VNLRTAIFFAFLFSCKSAGPGTDPTPTDASRDEVVSPGELIPIGAVGEIADNPTAPKTEAGLALPWPTAPLMEGVTLVADRDSAVLELPAVAGAKDYRAYRLSDGVTIEGTETVKVLGGDVHCAGYRQRNIKAPAQLELMRKLEITGLGKDSVVVVEAVDQTCPFTGAMGLVHKKINVISDNADPVDAENFEIFTEAEIRARFGSLIRNGHGAGPLAAPADPALAAPRVLARTTLRVKAKGTDAPPPTATFFDDFASDDQPVFVSTSSHPRSQQGKIYQNAKWSFYTYGADDSQFFIERGKLHTVTADWHQDIFSTNIAYPRAAVQLDDAAYLKATFDVHSNSSSRRYWWTFLCGAETAGATMDANGLLKGQIVQTSFFYQNDGRNPSVDGWNCLQIFARDGWPSTIKNQGRPESDIRVMVNTANAGDRDSVVNVSPDQYKLTGSKDNPGPPGWYGILDDQTVLAPRTKITLYIRRDRVIMFVNGEQRLCNDFTTHKLTMAEGALGFGQVLYHSTAERKDFTASFWDRTGQRYYMTNTPYVDERTWDNVGYEEKIGAPANFDASKCFSYQD
jgi:hypothetical protein